MGSSGYVRNDADPEELRAAIRVVAAGRTYLEPSVTPQVLVLAEAPGDLAERELQRCGNSPRQSNQQVAAALSVTEETVKSHVAHVLQVDNRSQVVTTALKLGLVSLTTDWTHGGDGAAI